MQAGISIEKVWFDDDVLEFKLEVSDGRSLFSNNIYVDHSTLDEALLKLTNFKSQLYAGIVDIEFGSFGPEFANGAICARLHFFQPGKIFVTCKTESDFQDFTVNKVASTATLFLRTEPVLLDKFIENLNGLRENRQSSASLKGI